VKITVCQVKIKSVNWIATIFNSWKQYLCVFNYSQRHVCQVYDLGLRIPLFCSEIFPVEMSLSNARHTLTH
jgi:hypothetical protein